MKINKINIRIIFAINKSFLRFVKNRNSLISIDKKRKNTTFLKYFITCI